jgi:signal transduction histidine kinase
VNPSLKKLQVKFSRIRLVWKLMISYLVVIVVGLATMALAAESVAPTSFNRHMQGMEMMMREIGPGIGIQQLEADLFDNFRAAVTEALFVAATAAVVTAILVSIFVTRRVVTPIQQMMQASRRIAAGHYRERVEVASEDELGQLAYSFNQMASTLAQTEAMRRELIANVTHELRTPLASIKGYMEGLIDGVLSNQPDTYQQIYREADRLQRLVNDLQELSRVEAGAFELDRRPLTITQLVRQIATRLRPQFEEKGVILHLDLPPNLPAVLADEDRISQVLLNLIGNALQYTPGGGAVTISVELPAPAHPLPTGETISNSQLLVTIRDTGMGIRPEHVPHLFTRFYRVDKSRSRAGGGSGIGLTITKHLVEAHGGFVWAESKGEGQGSVFGFSLPLVRNKI